MNPSHLEDALGLKEFVVEVEASLCVNEEERGWRNDLFLSTKYVYILYSKLQVQSVNIKFMTE